MHNQTNVENYAAPYRPDFHDPILTHIADTLAFCGLNNGKHDAELLHQLRWRFAADHALDLSSEEVAVLMAMLEMRVLGIPLPGTTSREITPAIRIWPIVSELAAESFDHGWTGWALINEVRHVPA